MTTDKTTDMTTDSDKIDALLAALREALDAHRAMCAAAEAMTRHETDARIARLDYSAAVDRLRAMMPPGGVP